MKFVFDDGASVRHALVKDAIAYRTPAERDTAIATLQVAAARSMRDIAGRAKVGSMTEIEAVVRSRGGDTRLLQTLKMFTPTQTPDPQSHRLDRAIANLEGHQHQRLSRDLNTRLAGYYKDIKAREQAPVEQGPALSEAGQSAVAKLESLEQRLLFVDAFDPSRLVRATLAKRQLLEGDEAIGLKMFDEVFQGEKTLAVERKQRLSERQDELRKEMESIDPFDLDPKPQPVAEQPERSLLEQSEYEVQQALNDMYRREKEAALAAESAEAGE